MSDLDDDYSLPINGRDWDVSDLRQLDHEQGLDFNTVEARVARIEKIVMIILRKLENIEKTNNET